MHDGILLARSSPQDLIKSNGASVKKAVVCVCVVCVWGGCVCVCIF